MTGITRWREIEHDVQWGIFIMYGSALALGAALRDTGAAHAIVTQILGFGVTSPFVIFGILASLAFLLTEEKKKERLRTLFWIPSHEDYHNREQKPTTTHFHFHMYIILGHAQTLKHCACLAMRRAAELGKCRVASRKTTSF